jgi:hypothetical protein
MRLTDFCNQPTTRAPLGLPDSRARAPSALRLPESRRSALGQWPPTNPRVELRLTANLQLRPRSDLPGELPEGIGPERSWDGMRRDPGGASIESSFALHLPAAAFSTAHRACELASDALCRDPRRPDPTLRPNPARESHQARVRRRLVKDDSLCEARTPSLDECPLRRAGPARAWSLRPLRRPSR